MTQNNLDTFKRPMRDLRISVTDRCNFRCGYCMPRDVFGPDFSFLERTDLLSFEEIHRFSKLASERGVHKLRITGGEPLVRKDLPALIELLSNIENIDDICLTSNGAMLTKEKALELKKAGLNRITISLDALDNELFQQLADVRINVQKVLDGIDNAIAADLKPVKVNMVVMKGVNDHAIIDLVEYFRDTPARLRFIEFMDVGNSNGWNMDQVFTAQNIIDLINSHYPIEPQHSSKYGEVAKRWKYVDGKGEIGIISSVTQPFCQSCTRLRLSAEGQLYTCLFAHEGHDIRTLLREHPNDDAPLIEKIEHIWQNRDDQYSLLRGSDKMSVRPKIEMSYIGG